MKHIVYIHSSLTEAMAKSVVAYHGFKPDDVILVCGRSFCSNATWAGKIIREVIDLPEKQRVYHVPSIIGAINKFDRWLSSFCDGEYNLYAPQTMIRIVRMLANHPNCVATNYIEEGLAYYTESLCEDRRSRLSIYWLWPWNRIRRRGFLETGYGVAYVTRDLALLGESRKIILMPDFIESKFFDSVNLNPEDRVVIFALQTVKFWSVVVGCAYYQALRDELEYFSSRSDKIFFKLHPEQVNSEERHIVSELMSKYSGVEIPAETCLESIKCNGKSIIVVSRNSSVALYLLDRTIIARFFGAQMARYLPDQLDAFLRERELFEQIAKHPACFDVNQVRN